VQAGGIDVQRVRTPGGCYKMSMVSPVQTASLLFHLLSARALARGPLRRVLALRCPRPPHGELSGRARRHSQLPQKCARADNGVHACVHAREPFLSSVVV
jgi:hypothetical protein